MDAIKAAQAAIVNKIYIPKGARGKVEVKVLNGQLTIVRKDNEDQ